ncbi:hypothetical protein C0585_02345 [Candidatus Woesearchaeota archaeon]|nr:MAG: hypothetical protein C0585_02345 [Candidatus Woesearchaeota archaeon]
MIIGVVGKPSVGKSTFFKACTLADVEIANYPFTTIKPNHAIGFVKVDPCSDKELGKQCNPREGYCINHKRFVPVEMIDVAGLVPGASEGAGMGNQFLDDLRQADVLVHVIDVSGSTNEKGEPVEPLSYDPANDIRFLETELDNWYFGIFKKVWEKFARQIQQEHADVNKAIAKQFSGLRVTEDMVQDGVNKIGLDELKVSSWEESKLKELVKYLRQQTKPMIIAANKIDVPKADENYKKLKQEFPELLIIPTSAESELALKEAAKHGLLEYVPGENEFSISDDSKLNDKQKNALTYIQKNILGVFNSTGVQEVLDKATFDLLEYIPIYPGGVGKLTDQYGNVMPDCFLMPKGTTALDFAYRLHTDFGKNFVKAINVKTKMPINKDVPLSFGDVIEIMSSK